MVRVGTKPNARVRVENLGGGEEHGAVTQRGGGESGGGGGKRERGCACKGAVVGRCGKSGGEKRGEVA